MNKTELLNKKRNECLSLVRQSNRKINLVRYGKGESSEHRMLKAQTCIKLSSQNKFFITEARFTTGGVADILVLDDLKVIEICVSEKEERLAKKKKDYPRGLKFEVIKWKR